MVCIHTTILFYILRSLKLLKRDNRVKSNKEFSYIYKKGKGISSDICTLIVCPNSDKFKIGFSISKKVGKAVVRNKIKRVLSEIFRLKINDLLFCKVVLVVKPNIVNKSYNEIEKIINNLIFKSKILKK